MAHTSLSNILASGRTLVMDGAMGTRMLRAGLKLGECGPAWNLTQANTILRIHADYLASGAEVLLANTFLSDPASLARHSLADRLADINDAAIRVAREAPGPRRYVLGDIGPILTPGRYEEFADRDALSRTAASLADADGILFETCSTPAALSAIEYVFHRVGEVDALPLLLSLTYHRKEGNLVTFSGHAPETFARHAARHGVAALGVNCGKDIDMADIAEIVRRYRDETDLPLFVRPNAGTPNADGSYPHLPTAMASALPANVAMVGGCCGTTPEYISMVRAALADT